MKVETDQKGGRYRFLEMLDCALWDVAVHLEDGKPVLAYKRLVELEAIVTAELESLNEGFHGE